MFSFRFLIFYFNYESIFDYGTIANIPPLFQTEPDGKPLADVGMLLIDRLFTNVVQALSAVIFEPIIIALEQVLILLHIPPNIAEHEPETVFL